jgi:hypothetical protein
MTGSHKRINSSPTVFHEMFYSIARFTCMVITNTPWSERPFLELIEDQYDDR